MNESDRIKFTVYLPGRIIDKLKIQAAQTGLMTYSGITEGIITRVFTELGDMKDFAELMRTPKYQNVLTDFMPVKRGRPPLTRKIVIKKKITFYVSHQFFKLVRRFQRRFNLSSSSLVEMSLLIHYKGGF